MENNVLQTITPITLKKEIIQIRPTKIQEFNLVKGEILKKVTYLLNVILCFNYANAIWRKLKLILLPKLDKPPKHMKSYQSISLF